MLQEIKNLYSKIFIRIALEDLTEEFIHNLLNAIKKAGKGKTEIIFTFYSQNGSNNILKWNMVSKKYKILITNEFIEFLNENQVDFRLVSETI